MLYPSSKSSTFSILEISVKTEFIFTSLWYLKIKLKSAKSSSFGLPVLIFLILMLYLSRVFWIDGKVFWISLTVKSKETLVKWSNDSNKLWEWESIIYTIAVEIIPPM